MTDKLGNKGVSYLFLLILLSIITGCGGGGSSSDSADGVSHSSQAVGGGGVKGPLANAEVSVYTLDTTQIDFKGATVATATTNAGAAITGLALPFPLNPPYVLEFTSNAATTDLTTGQFPVIPTLRSVITQEMLAGGKQVYATPLTTMAVDLAIAKADSSDAPFTGDGDDRASNAEFLAALPVAASQVASTVGFGLDSSVDIMDTPPIVDDTTETVAKQKAVAAYRAAVEALSAVAFEIHQQGMSGSPEAVLNELTADLADGEIDGVINGSSSDIITTQALIVLASDPAYLAIPNSNDGNGNPILVGEVNRLLADETSETGATVDTAALSNGSIELRLQPATGHPDIDGDGIPNAEDAFPTNPTESEDTDGDGIGDGADHDDDNDGVADGSDPDPQDPIDSGDTDQGGTESPAASSLSMSLTPEASDPSALEGKAVSGSIHVYVSSEKEIEEVRFYLDGTLVRTERHAPYAFNGDTGSLISPFDTAQLTVGAHVISAEVDFRDGTTEVLTANFMVEAPAPIVAVPELDPPGGIFTDSVIVSISTSTNGATIYYTLDGSSPLDSESSYAYGGPIEITSSATLSAVAVMDGYADSRLATAEFIIAPHSAAEVVMIPKKGDWAAAINALQPGQIGQLEPGRYLGGRTIEVKGTAEKPVIIRGSGHLQSIFDGNKGDHALQLKNCKHLIVENVTVTNPSPYGIDGRKKYTGKARSRLSNGIVIKGGSHITIRHSRFVDIATRGIFVGDGVDRLTVERNLFLRVGDDTASGDIAAGGKSTRLTIRENLFAGNVDGVVFHGAGAGHLIERNIFCFLKWENSIDIKFHHVVGGEDPWSIIRRNVIYANYNYYSGIELQNSTDNIKVYENAIHGAKTYGLQIRGRFANPMENFEIVGNWFNANGDKKTGLNMRVTSSNPGDVSNVYILHNTFTGYQNAMTLNHGKNVFVYNNVFDSSPVKSSISKLSAGTNLYHNTTTWAVDKSAIRGKPVYESQPVGPLTKGSPGKGQATVLAGHDWGQNIGLPQPTVNFASLEPSILRALERVFTSDDIKACLDQGGVPYTR